MGAVIFEWRCSLTKPLQLKDQDESKILARWYCQDETNTIILTLDVIREELEILIFVSAAIQIYGILDEEERQKVW